MTAPDLTNSKFWIVVPQAGINQIYNPRIDPPVFDTYLTAVSAALAESSAEQRKGAYSVAVTPQTGVASGLYYSAVSVTNGSAYTFSCDVKGVAGQAMRIYIANSAGTVKATTTFTATGYWERHSVTHTAAETQTNYRVYVIRDSVASTSVFYVDGLQFETGDEMTTFIHGDAGDGYSWSGLPRVSASVRSDRTRAGGSLLCINDYAKILQVFGFGMGQFEQIMYPMSNGGDYYQQHLRRSRNIGFLLAYWGDNQGDMQRNRNTILEAVRPDYLDNQPVKIIYQGFDDLGNEATNPLEITCVLQPSHVDTPSLPVFQKDTLMFTVPSGHFDGAYEEGAELGLYDELAVEHILMKDNDTAEWNNLDGGVNLDVNVMVEGPDGSIYVGGEFLSIGGDTSMRCLAKWDGVNWSAVGNFATAASLISVSAIVFDASGVMYVGGSFSDVGGVTNTNIAKYDGTNWSAVGTAVTGGGVRSIIFSNTGVLFIGGDFTSAGGDTNCNSVAYYDSSTSDWEPLSTGLNALVLCLLWHNDYLYIGGNFTDAAYPYLCKWNGTAFSSVGDILLNNGVSALAKDSKGNIIAGGAFTDAGNNIGADYIGIWNGTVWESFNGSPNGAVKEIAVSNDNTVYVAGTFSALGSAKLAENVGYYKNGAWHSLGITLPEYSFFSAVKVVYSDSKGNLYVGGRFATTYASENALVSSPTVIDNTGNMNTYPTIVVSGPGRLEQIVNHRNKKSIEFDGLILQDNETIVINLDPSNLFMRSSWGNRSVYSSNRIYDSDSRGLLDSPRGSVMSYLSAGSDYGNFSLEPGINRLSVFMSHYTSTATIGCAVYTPRFWNIEGAIYE